MPTGLTSGLPNSFPSGLLNILASANGRAYRGALMRLCRKTGCAHEASATCSFHYPLKQVWIAPLSADPQPGSYDLCEDHADRLVAPLGWLLTDIRAEAEVETLRPEALEPSPAAGLAV